MTFRKSNIKNCSFGCFFYAPMVENWMTKMLENWEITDILQNLSRRHTIGHQLLNRLFQLGFLSFRSSLKVSADSVGK